MWGVERRLSEEERKRTELIVRLKPGSTTFLSELAPVLNRALVALTKNMSGTESLIALLGVAAIVGGAYVWKARLNTQARLREIDHYTRMSEEETKRYRIIEQLAAENGRVASSLADVAAAQDGLRRRMDSASIAKSP